MRLSTPPEVGDHLERARAGDRAGPRHRPRGHQLARKRSAAGLAAGTAVAAREQVVHLLEAGVLFDMQEPMGGSQDRPEEEREPSQDPDGDEDCLHARAAS